LKPKGSQIQRLIGAIGIASLLGLIVYAEVTREAQTGDSIFWLMRWPVWFAMIVLVPLIVARFVLWIRHRIGRLDGTGEIPPEK